MWRHGEINIGCFPALDLFEQSHCTDWIIFVVYDHSPKYSFSGTWFMLSNDRKLYQYKRDHDSWHHGNLLEWHLFLIFSGKVAVLNFLALQDKHNIRTLSVHITLKSLWNRWESSPEPRFFPVSKARRNKCYVCRQCMYIVYIFFTRQSQYFTDIYI